MRVVNSERNVQFNQLRKQEYSDSSVLFLIPLGPLQEYCELPNNMGQHGSKSSIEARVIFQRAGAVDMYQKTDACATPASVVRIQKKVTTQAVCLHSPQWAPEKSTPHSWQQSRRDTGLVYVMDNPTGGVWVKPEEKWGRSWS